MLGRSVAKYPRFIEESWFIMRKTSSLAAACVAAVAPLMVIAPADMAKGAELQRRQVRTRQQQSESSQLPKQDLYAPASLAQLHRSGHPELISRLAKPSDTRAYFGYYVGGGAKGPRPWRWPTPHEGSWGWDYVGSLLARRVCLKWWQQPVHQGGSGSYEPDGPKIFNFGHEHE